MVASPFLIAIVALIAVMYGTKDINVLTVWQAITVFDPANIDHQIIRTSRIPRICAVLLVGAFLAVAGAVMQGITETI